MLGKVLGGAIGAVGSLIGGSMSNNANQKMAQQSWQNNYNAQKEFAQNSIQWRKQDAINAGINPYAVVGGQTTGYTPQDVSYSDSFGRGFADAANRLGDTLGQLQMRSAVEDLKSKKLENDKKSLELANKVIKQNMGQVPKTITDPIRGITGGNIATNGRGGQYIVPLEDASLDSFSGMKVGANTMYDREMHTALAKHNGQDLGLGILGYQTIPKNDASPYSKIMRQAEKIAKQAGNTAAGVLSYPSLLFKGFLDSILK